MDDGEEIRKKNAEEVRRILEERGYSTMKPDKEEEKHTSALKFVILFVLIIAAGVTAYIALQSNKQPEERKVYTSSTRDDDIMIMAYQDCLDRAEIAGTYITESMRAQAEMNKYSAILNCYALYPEMPTEAELNSAEKKATEAVDKYIASLGSKDSFDYESAFKEIQDSYTRTREAMNKINAEYDAKTREIEENYRKELATIDESQTEEQKQNETYIQQMQEKMAQDQADRLAADARAKAERCNAFKAEHDNKTVEEMALSDDLIKSYKQLWDKEKDKVKDCTGLSGSMRTTCLNNQAKQLETVEYYKNRYYEELEDLREYYQILYDEACN